MWLAPFSLHSWLLLASGELLWLLRPGGLRAAAAGRLCRQPADRGQQLAAAGLLAAARSDQPLAALAWPLAASSSGVLVALVVEICAIASPAA